MRHIASIGPMVIAALALAPGAGRAHGGQTAQFGTEVDLVQFQVDVRDENGDFVRGLRPEDFLLRVDGEARPVQVAYEIDLGTREQSETATAATPGASQALRPTIAARRRILLLFDLSFTTLRGLDRARRAAQEFVLEDTRAGDLVAVATLQPDAGLDLVSPFTSERATLIDRIARVGVRDASSDEPIDLEDEDLNTFTRDTQRSQQALRVMNYLEQLEGLAHALRTVPGRKHVVMFSRGFAPDIMLRLEGGVRASLEDAAATLASSAAAVHVIDPGGMRGYPTGAEVSQSPFGSGGANAADLDDGRNSLAWVADETGGTMTWNRNDLRGALQRVRDVTDAYYVLGYRRAASDPATVALEVEVLRDGARVAGAPERYAVPPAYADMTPVERQLQFADALADDVERVGLEFDAGAVSFPASGDRGLVAVAVRVPPDQLVALARARGDRRVQLEIGVIVRVDGETVSVVRRGIGVALDGRSLLGPARTPPLEVVEYLSAPVGHCEVRVLVRELEVGRLSSLIRDCRIQSAPDGAFLAPPILLTESAVPPRTDAAATPASGPLDFAGRRMVPSTEGSIAPGEPIRVLVIARGMSEESQAMLLRSGLPLAILNGAATHPVERVRILESAIDGPDQVRVVVTGLVPRTIPAGPAVLRVGPVAGTGPTADLSVHVR